MCETCSRRSENRPWVCRWDTAQYLNRPAGLLERAVTSEFLRDTWTKIDQIGLERVILYLAHSVKWGQSTWPQHNTEWEVSSRMRQRTWLHLLQTLWRDPTDSFSHHRAKQCFYLQTCFLQSSRFLWGGTDETIAERGKRVNTLLKAKSSIALWCLLAQTVYTAFAEGITYHLMLICPCFGVKLILQNLGYMLNL